MIEKLFGFVFFFLLWLVPISGISGLAADIVYNKERLANICFSIFTLSCIILITLLCIIGFIDYINTI